MKKYLICIALCVVAMLAVVGCGQTDSGSQADSGSAAKESVDLDSLKTLGDAFAIEAEENQSGFTDKVYVYAFTVDGTNYRVIADIPKEVKADADKLDASKEDFEEKSKELFGPLEITKRENLSEMTPSKEDLDKYIGKTGQELLDEGWLFSAYLDDEKAFYMDYDWYECKITFDKEIKYDQDNFDGEKEIKDLKVKTIEYSGMGDPTRIDE